MASSRAISTPLFILAGAVLATSPSFANPEREDGDGFRVNSADSADYQGTREDVESKLTDELAEKLRQFDEWADETEERNTTSDAQGSLSAGSSGGGGGGASATTLTATSSPAANGQANAAPSRRAQTTEDESANTVATTGEIGTEIPRSAPQPPPRADKKAQEDDVARMIREAAEQETDPARKKALMEQYDAYLENL